MIVRHALLPLVLIGLLLQPAVHTQECIDSIPIDVLLEAHFLPADNVTAYPKAKLPALLANMSLDIQASIRAAQEETINTLREDFNLADYYYDVCPTYGFLLPYDSWYFEHSTLQLKCFSLQPLYIAWCRTRYCSWDNLKLFRWWQRCVPEWRYQYFWAASVNQKGTWSLRYLKLKLPACCSCKRYYRYTVEQCMVSDMTDTRR